MASKTEARKYRRTMSAEIQEFSEKWTDAGQVLYIRISRRDEKPMGWEEIWEAFASRYPNRWAIQLFPPKEHLVNERNVYHLFVLPEGHRPMGLDISDHGKF